MRCGQRGFQEDRRNGERVSLVAQVTLTEAVSGTRMVLVTRDLGESGCWLNLVNPFPVDTQVAVRIFTPQGTVDANGIVVHSEYRGMGIAFRRLELLSATVLRRCLQASGMPICNGSK